MESDHTGHSCRLDFAGSLYPQKEAADSCSIKGCDKVNFSRQCCDLTLCPYHWRNYCDVKKWDHHLSKCANEKCDILKIAEREKINQHNIWSILNIPGNNSYCHISTFRRTQTVAFAKRKASDIEHNRDTNISQPVANPKPDTGRISEIETKNLPIKKRQRVYLEEKDTIEKSNVSDTLVEECEPNHDISLHFPGLKQFMEFIQIYSRCVKNLSTFREDFNFYLVSEKFPYLKSIVTSIIKEPDIQLRKQICDGIQEKIKTAINQLFDIYQIPLTRRALDAKEMIALKKNYNTIMLCDFLPDIITDEIIVDIITVFMRYKILIDRLMACTDITKAYLHSIDNLTVVLFSHDK